MGASANVSAVFGINFGADDLGEAREDCDAGTDPVAASLEVTEAEDAEGSVYSVLYARRSYRSLLNGKTVEIAVLDVGALSVDDRWREALRAFCEERELKWSEPRWLVVSDVL